MIDTCRLQRLAGHSVLPLDMVEKSITLCKDTSSWFFRPKASRIGHLSLQWGLFDFFCGPFHPPLHAMTLPPHLS